MHTEAAYQSTLEYLYSFVDYSLTKADRYLPEQFNLERMRVFVHTLGEPQSTYPIIHIAGTKGKGSTAAMCASVLQAAGYKVGLYTSPHLVDYTERIQVNRQPIPPGELVSLVEEVKPLLIPGTHLTTFEITTALAFLYFSRCRVDAAVVEVGLGGRLDATNVVLPAVSVITSLSYDHTQFLGETLAQIASEKAGIIKDGIPVVLAPQRDEARHVIANVASERRSRLIEVGKDLHFSELEHSLHDGQKMQLWWASEQGLMNQYLENKGEINWEPVHLNVPLLGYHQIENAATAYAAIAEFNQQALPLSPAAIQRGFSQVQWPGRFEIVQTSPPVVLDCAHNRDSALKLRLTLDEYFPGIPVILLFGASEDKDIKGMFAELMPRVEQVIVTRSFHPRAMEPEKLAELVHQFGRPARVIEKVEDALELAMQMVGSKSLLLVTGSIFVAAAARHTWYNRKVS